MDKKYSSKDSPTKDRARNTEEKTRSPAVSERGFSRWFNERPTDYRGVVSMFRSFSANAMCFYALAPRGCLILWLLLANVLAWVLIAAAIGHLFF